MKVFEDYVKDVLKIPHCNFEGVHPKIAYEIIVGLSLMYEMYPFFNKVISSIGSVEDYNNMFNLLNFSSKKYKEGTICNRLNNYTYKHLINNFDIGKIEKYANSLNEFNTKIKYNKILKEDGGMYSFSAYNYHSCHFFHICIRNYIKRLDMTDIYNLCNYYYGRISIYHEFGHLLDFFLKINSNKKFLKIIEGHDIKTEISEYATTNNEELVAEAFSYYIFSKHKLTNLEKKLNKIEFSKNDFKANSLIQEIGKLIDEEYEKFVKFKRVKFIKEKYNFNKKFTIQKNSNNINIDKIKEKIKKYI